jgi:hypothetical protein
VGRCTEEEQRGTEDERRDENVREKERSRKVTDVGIIRVSGLALSIH